MNKTKIKSQILAKIKIEDYFKKIYLVGSINESSKDFNDIDLIIIVENTKQAFSCAFSYSEQAMNLSIDLGVFVSPFFISEDVFQESNSQFYSNVKNTGEVIYG